MFNPGQYGRSFDQPYHYEQNLSAFTWVLIAIGLRPFSLKRSDNDMRQTVWAESAERVMEYASGKVTEIKIEKGAYVDPTDVIMLPEKDGGGINVGGYRMT